MGDGSKANGSGPGREGRRRPLAPVATLLDLYRVGGLFNARDVQILAEATDDSSVVSALRITGEEVADIRRRADSVKS